MIAGTQLVYNHDELYAEAINRSVSQEDMLIEQQFSKQFEQESMALAGLPSSFSFVKSGYALGLSVTVSITSLFDSVSNSLHVQAILLNRIQHLVVPRPRVVYSHFRRRRSSLNHLWSLFFPIDLSSLAFRLCFRLPSSYLLIRSLAMSILPVYRI
jgi:hypothetical protein